MSRTVGGIVSAIGVILAAIAVFNIHFGDGVPVGQLVIGSIGLVLAFLFTVSLQENPGVQRIAALIFIGLSALMIAPAVIRAFAGTVVSGLQIATAVLGLALLLVGWRMLPR
jgi:FtsH-binding integral membrane protein